MGCFGFGRHCSRRAPCRVHLPPEQPIWPNGSTDLAPGRRPDLRGSPNCSPPSPTASSSTTEFEVRDRVHKIGARPSRPLWTSGKRGYQGSSRAARTATNRPGFVDYRPRRPKPGGELSLERPITTASLRHSPSLDDILGLSRQALTPGRSESDLHRRRLDSFGEAADVVLSKLAGLRSPSRPCRGPARRSRDIGARLAAGETFGASEAWGLAQGRRWEDLRLRFARPQTSLGMQRPRRCRGRRRG